MVKNIISTRRWVLFILFISLVVFSAAQETNLTDQEYSRQCLANSYDLMGFLEADGFNTFRINDTLDEAQTIYDSQILIERQGRKGEFAFVIESCEDVSVLYDLAFNSRDDLSALRDFFASNSEEGMNTESIDFLIFEIEQEIIDERYEKVQPLVEEAYEEISRVQEEFSRLNRFYSATTQNFKTLFFEYGKYVLSTLAILFIFYFSYRIRFRRALINSKIRSLKLRKASLKALMEKTQKDYFQKINISESDYHLRSKNFAMLIRDIDRQIPLLEEKLIKVEMRKDLERNVESDFKEVEKHERKQEKRDRKEARKNKKQAKSKVMARPKKRK